MHQKLRLFLSGGAAGLVCGLFGAGGGMVLVPLLTGVCGFSGRDAFASALAVMLPVSLVSLTVLQFTGGLPFTASLPYLAGGLVGGFAAGIVYKKIPTALLHKAMGLFILWGGARLLWS
ncbi:MAG: sulfite exporter TauE/SafE family protein [Oscillospiraceae bacterium]|nr:sulfite exporter TauE/SafE family protein [Oscillospiraceae bacterium]